MHESGADGVERNMPERGMVWRVRALRGRPERIKSDAQVAAKRKKKRKGRKKKKKKEEEGRLPSFLFSSLIHVFKIRSYIP